MAAFSLLPKEILVHIHNLSNEGELAEWRQWSRFTFSLISRASFLATADATDFCVAGASQATAFVAKLEREKALAALEERKAKSGRTTRATTLSITRVSEVRRLSILVDKSAMGKALASVIQATPNLDALELEVQASYRLGIPLPESMDHFQDAFQELTCLRELRIRSPVMEADMLLWILTSLKELEVLDLSIDEYEVEDEDTTSIDYVALSRIRDVRICLGDFSVDRFSHALLAALGYSSSTGIQKLDLKSTAFDLLSPDLVEPLIPLVANVVHLHWTPGRSDPVKDDARDAVLALLAAMTDLQTISVSMWERLARPDEDLNARPIDLKLFDTLATLPSLHAVNLVVESGDLADEHVISYLKSHHTLQSLSLELPLGRWGSKWTSEQRGRVRDAANEAEVAFTYEGSLQ